MEYLEEVQKYFSDPNSSEHSYRTPFENYLKEIFPAKDGYFTQQDQKAINGNKPDFIILKNKVPILYIEVKKPGEDLDKIEKSNQADRYFGYDNLIISDYVNFRFFRYGKKYNEEISLADIDLKNKNLNKLNGEKLTLLSKTILDFSSSHKEEIKHGKHLAEIMGGKALRIRENVFDILKNKNTSKVTNAEEVIKLQDVMRENLIHNLSDEDFSDMYAQTLVYGLFAARYNDKSVENFSRLEALDLAPKTNPFLKSFFGHIAGVSFPDRLKFIVDELCEVFLHANVHKLLNDFYNTEKNSKDPIIHFYEDFLKEYDSKKKMEMGVFYTPKPVVDFIIRSVDEILKTEFGLNNGLSDTEKIKVKIKESYQAKNSNKSEQEKNGKMVEVEKEFHKVQILDVATGTGTFLNETVNHIYKSFENQKGRWESYVNENLLPRLHGFELMMASYTIAHLKLGMTLADKDINLNNLKERIGIYLTNTLDEPQDFSNQGTLFGLMDSIAIEAKSASKIKRDYPIMCVIGNPPYSGISQNKNYTKNNDYKVEIGGSEKLKEKKNWLDDDYVKFIRFAESLIEKNGEGIIGMITAHGYVDNPTFRGMRWHLRKTFDKIYIVDLHGNSRKKEIAPDGSKDENVFDIMTGVSIIFGVKKNSEEKNKKLGVVYKYDLYGKRKEKFEELEKSNIENIKWIKLPENTDLWNLEGEGKNEYQKGFSVAEIFPLNTTGIVTMGDSFIIDQDKDILEKRLSEFLNENITENELKSKYDLGKNYAKWIIDNKSKIINDKNLLTKIAYRPFDIRYTYFDNNLVWRTRTNVMKNFVNRENVGLVFKRGDEEENSAPCFITNSLIDFRSWSRPGMQGGDFVAPAFLYSGDNNSYIKSINLTQEFLGLLYKNKIYDSVETINPINVIDYIYAVLHSSEYRIKYKEFLKIDFPRVPYPTDKKKFFELVSIGEKLRKLHLMEDKSVNEFITAFNITGDDIVENRFPLFKEADSITGNLTRAGIAINEKQIFEPHNSTLEDLRIAWNFYVGGYQPAQKYLKDRRGKKLTNDEIEQYQRIIKVLVETNKLMKEIKL